MIVSLLGWTGGGLSHADGSRVWCPREADGAFCEMFGVGYKFPIMFHPTKIRLSIAFVLGLLQAASAQNATTTPVGVMQYSFAPNSYVTMGVPLVRDSVATGTVTGGTAGTITLNGTQNLAAVLSAGTPYYVEITGHPDGVTSANVGDRFDVDTAATISAASNVIVINTSSPNNTAAGDFSGLTGYNLAIRPHWTLADLFGTGASATSLQSSPTFTSADQVHFWTGTGMSTYFFRQNSAGTIREWRNTRTGTVNQDGAIIPPGVGVFFKRAGSSPLAITVLGNVRGNKFVQPLALGTHLFAQGFPKMSSPTDLSLMPVSGLVCSTSFAAADQIWLWTGTGISTYWLKTNSAGTIKEWRNTTTGTTVYDTTQFLDPQKAFFVKTQASIDPVEVAKPY